MVTSNYGKLSEYGSNTEDWQSYIERLELYFTANDIGDVVLNVRHSLNSLL